MRYPLAVISLLLLGSPVLADDLDDFIRDQLRKRHVPGLSIAIIQDGKIVKAMAYGFTDKNEKTPLTTATLFQAGSVSKSVAAVGALYLTEAGKLSLDEDVNVKLRTWKVPENEFTKDKKVTLRGLLSHTTGLTVHGFPGYEVGKPIPTVPQILNGATPANTAPVRVDFVPGTRWRYSGGSYTVMQQLVLDVTGKPFPQFMQETVLGPLSMTESTYQQPLPADKAKLTATGYYGDRSEVKGRWHIYPEMAAAGLWTTPSDLARFAIGIQHTFAGEPKAVLSQTMTRQMLTDQKDNDGLGVFLEGEGHTMRFGHNGRDEGFDALLTAGVETGQGVAIMINANDNSRMMGQIVNAVAKHYNWLDYKATKTADRKAVPVEAKTLAAYEGRYEFANNRMITLMAEKNRLVTLVDGFGDEEFVPETPTRFVSVDRDAYLTFTPDATGKITALEWKQDKDERKIPRIGPLFHAPKPGHDTNATRTHQIETALMAMSKGGKAVAETPGITPGARRGFSQGSRSLDSIKSMTFISDDDVKNSGIERHEGKVSQILNYKLVTDTAQQYVIVYLTSDGLVTDYDIVEK
ncbi:serine hydrolase [Spirosoma utsteinense]|uniref:serine hydrolase n=1 Tax=Spirosoma utsteinense TaxID=2585773 RepID=UPI0016448A53|nr:serine hydrolase [Spirosoma utsteinense]MBC3785949.1 CubicO group peptidase (beta-lactamase class C family) [Spirosoma utsteinense]